MDERLCCACLSNLDACKMEILSSIFDLEQGFSYADCIKACTSVQLDKGYHICVTCIAEMQTSYGFYKKVRKSQGVLKDVAAKSNKIDAQEDAIEVHAFHADCEHDPKCEEETAVAKSTEIEVWNIVDCTEEESVLDSKDDQYSSDDIEILKTTDSIEEDTTLQSNKIFEQDDQVSMSSDETSFQQIEIIPVEACRTFDAKDTTTDSKRKISIEKQRKRFFGKFSCDYCDKMFPNHSRMILHRRSHEPDRPKFACNECGRIYSTNQALDVHIRSVHKMSGNACKMCSKVFSSQASLTVHMRFHTGNFPYVCETCGHKFAQLCHLNTHRKVKHNSVRFCCNHPSCGKFFTSTASLRNHEFSHGLMPFECEFCHRGYPAKSKLKVHVRKSHKKELTLDELEPMRRFHVMRSKPNVIQVDVSSLQKS